MSSPAEFVEFLRRNIGDLENVTNGNEYVLSLQDMNVLRPDNMNDLVIAKIIRATLDLKMTMDMQTGNYHFWYDPL